VFTATTPSKFSPETDSRLPPPRNPAKIDQTQAEIERQQQIDRDTRRQEAELTRTPYEKAVERLPLHTGPLYVEQVTLDPTHRLVVSVQTERSFCGRSPSQRQAAVADFYGKAVKLMRARRVKGFELFVSPLSKPPTAKYDLAVGRRGSISLTAYGRGNGPC
jgi:hypothetical protein